MSREHTLDQLRASLQTNVIVVGRDAVAVETVGATLVGLKPEKMSVIQEVMKRGFGDGNIKEIEIPGSSIESLEERLRNV